MPLFLSPRHRRAECNFLNWFHNRLDSHLYLDSMRWTAMSTSMWLQPPPSEGGVRSRAIELLQSRPHTRFYCTLSRTARATLAAKIAPQRVATEHQCAFLIPARSGIPDLLITHRRRPSAAREVHNAVPALVICDLVVRFSAHRLVAVSRMSFPSPCYTKRKNFASRSKIYLSGSVS